MRLRFTIRDLLWLTVVAALILGWWLNLGQVASQRDQARREARDATNTLDRYRAAYTSQQTTGNIPAGRDRQQTGGSGNIAQPN